MIIEAGRHIGQLWSKLGLFLKMFIATQHSRQGEKGFFFISWVFGFFKLALLQGICSRPLTQAACLIRGRKICNSKNTSVSLEIFFFFSAIRMVS